MINKTEAAQQAVEEVDSRVEGTLGASAVKKAEFYVDQAIKSLRAESGGYNPNVLAPELGTIAVVEYAKAKLMGQSPVNTGGYVQAKKDWAKAAAAQNVRQGNNRIS